MSQQNHLSSEKNVLLASALLVCTVTGLIAIEGIVPAVGLLLILLAVSGFGAATIFPAIYLWIVRSTQAFAPDILARFVTPVVENNALFFKPRSVGIHEYAETTEFPHKLVKAIYSCVCVLSFILVVAVPSIQRLSEMEKSSQGFGDLFVSSLSLVVVALCMYLLTEQLADAFLRRQLFDGISRHLNAKTQPLILEEITSLYERARNYYLNTNREVLKTREASLISESSLLYAALEPKNWQVHLERGNFDYAKQHFNIITQALEELRVNAIQFQQPRSTRKAKSDLEAAYEQVDVPEDATDEQVRHILKMVRATYNESKNIPRGKDILLEKEDMFRIIFKARNMRWGGMSDE